MKTQQRKTSDVIALAVNDSRYLQGTFSERSEMFLCRMLEKLRNEGEITSLECAAAHNAIDKAINYKCTLYSFLYMQRVKGYRVASSSHARQPNDIRVQFWAMLCMRLKAQGK